MADFLPSNLDRDLFADLHDRAASGPIRLRELLSTIVDRLGYQGRQSEFAELVGTAASNFSNWKNENNIPSTMSLDRIVDAVAGLGYYLDPEMLYASASYSADLKKAEQTPDEYFVELGKMVKSLPDHVRTAIVSSVIAQVTSILAVYRHDEPIRAMHEWYYNPPQDRDR